MTRVCLIIACGFEVGYGHLSRSAVLGEALAEAGAEVEYRLTGMEFADRLRGRRVQPFDPDEAYDADIVCVDGYALPHDRIRAMSAGLMVVIDDLAEHSVPADVVINQNLYAEALAYPDVQKILRGPAYALVDPAFASLREQGPTDKAGRLVVSLGGASAFRGMASEIAVCLANELARPVDLALPVTEASSKSLVAHERVRVVAGQSLAQLLAQSDLIVCGLGVTYLEVLAARRRVVGLCLVDNQRLTYDHARNLAFPVLDCTSNLPEPRQIVHEVRQALSEPAPVVSGLDGKGAQRAALALLEARRSQTGA